MTRGKGTESHAAWRGALLLARATARRQRRSLLVLTLLLALGTTVVLASAVIADRTSTAYDRYLDRADVGDLVVNPSLLTRQIDAAVRDLPGGDDVHTDFLLVATIDDGAPRPAYAVNNDLTTQVRGSLDGRYVDVDRPAIHEGRLPTGTGEAFLAVDTAADRGLEVGDPLTVAFWPSLASNEPSGQEIEPIGVETLTVVGTGTFADGVLPDELYPQDRILVSPDVTERYSCLPESPPPDTPRAEALAAIMPPDCAVLFPYYSLALPGGADQASATLTAYYEQAQDLTAELPASLQEADYGYVAIPNTTADEAARVARSLQPSVTVTVLLAVTTAFAALALVLLAAGRVVRRSRVDAEVFEELGAARPARALGLGLPFVATGALGLLAGAVLAIPFTALGPLGRAARIEPDAGVTLAPGLTALVLGIGLLVLLLGLLPIVWRLSRPALRQGARPARPSRLQGLVRVLPVAWADGAGALLGGRRGADGPVAVAGSVVALAALAASIVFGSSLGTLLAEPSRYGWPADAAVVVGFGYGGLDIDAVSEALDGRDDVEGWTVLAPGHVAVDGDATTSTIDLGPDDLESASMIRGRRPTAPDEVAMGPRTAATAGVDVGDVTGIDAVFGHREMTVTGILATPPVGSYLSDRSGSGLGVYLDASAMGDGPGADQLASFVAIDLADGTEPADLWSDLGDEVDTWATVGGPPLRYVDPVRPPEIVNVDAIRRGPVVLAGVLALAVVIGVALALTLSVRARRRDLAVFRVLGFTTAQVRQSVRGQAVLTVALGALVGVPIGVAVGRIAWGRFARGLGVEPSPSVPLGALAGLVLVALVIALIVAVLPGSTASRARPAEVLRAA